MTDLNPRRVVGYVRVSTNKQEVGPEVQAAQLRAWADLAGNWSLELRQESAASAATMDKRPVLAQALRDLREGHADVLAVSKLDRLTRSVADFSAILANAEREGWHVVCLDLGVDTTTITGRAMAQVTAVFAEMERRRISERVRESMARIKAETGKHMGRPSEISDEAITRAVFLYGLGLSLQDVADVLNDEGIKTPRGGQWWPARVAAALRRGGVTLRGKGPIPKHDEEAA